MQNIYRVTRVKNGGNETKIKVLIYRRGTAAFHQQIAVNHKVKSRRKIGVFDEKKWSEIGVNYVLNKFVFSLSGPGQYVFYRFINNGFRVGFAHDNVEVFVKVVSAGRIAFYFSFVYTKDINIVIVGFCERLDFWVVMRIVFKIFYQFVAYVADVIFLFFLIRRVKKE